MRMPDVHNGETAMMIILSSQGLTVDEIYDYFDSVFQSWHENKFGNIDVLDVMGLSATQYEEWGYRRLDVDSLFVLASSR